MSSTLVSPPAPQRLMTANEFWDFVHQSENSEKCFELHRGEVIELSRPSVPHCRVCLRVGYLLEHYAQQVETGYVLSNDPGIILQEAPDTVVGPDVAYFAETTTFHAIQPKWAEVLPVLAVEVRSPSDRPNAIIAKIRDYLNSGVRVVWLIDYEDRTVSIFRPNTTPEVLSESETITGGEDLPSLAIRVAEIFRMPGEKPVA